MKLIWIVELSMLNTLIKSVVKDERKVLKFEGKDLDPTPSSSPSVLNELMRLILHYNFQYKKEAIM